MARPTKQGIDYFPLDTFFDTKLELFIAGSGAEGYGILIILWQLIYRDNGYYINYGDDLLLILRKHTLSSMETIKSTIDNAVSRGLFSIDMLKKHKVLTSSGLQKRFFIAAKQKKQVIAIRKLLLVDVSTFRNLVDTNGNRIIKLENATKEEVDEEVDGEVKVKHGTFKNVLLTDSEINDLRERFNSSTESRINSLSEYIASKGKKYKSHYATLLQWARREGRPEEGKNQLAGAK